MTKKYSAKIKNFETYYPLLLFADEKCIVEPKTQIKQTLDSDLVLK